MNLHKGEVTSIMYNGKHILIENGPGIGDVITLTPALKRLKQLFPECSISVVSNSGNLPIIDRLSYIDKTYGICKNKFLGRYYPAFHFREQDCIVLFSWQSHLTWAAKLLNVKNRYGYCREKYLKFNLFHKYLNSQGVKDITARTTFLTKELSKALSIDLSNEGICEVSMPNAIELEQTHNLLKTNNRSRSIQKYAVIAPFGNTARALPKPLLSVAIKHLINQYGYQCVIVNNIDCQLAHDLKQINPEKITNLCGKTNLMQLVALLQNAKLSITTDSAPMHISCAVSTPCISIFSNDSSIKWPPRKFCVPIDAKVSCSPCRPEHAQQCSNQICINSILPSEVLEKIDSVDSYINNKSSYDHTFIF